MKAFMDIFLIVLQVAATILLILVDTRDFIYGFGYGVGLMSTVAYFLERYKAST